MEDDIKILEEMFFDKEDFEPIGYIETHFTKEQQQAIENLIARNKELENITKQYNSYCAEAPENAQYEIVIADKRFFDMGIFEEQFIPKSKVRELREIDNIDLLQFKIKELLQEGDR